MCLCSSSLSARAAAGADLLLPDGGFYRGAINAQNQRHGVGGVEYRADGFESSFGQWHDGKLHGNGKQILPSGDSYEGDFVGGQRSGRGRYTWASDSVYEGEWGAGKRSGMGLEWNKNGTIQKCGRWMNSQLVEQRPVPRTKIPFGALLSEAGE